jgi:hypothetical protein
MTDDLFHARRRKLQDAVTKAVEDLLAHENLAPAGFSFPLDEKLTVTIADQSILADRDRLSAVQALKMNIGPGESFQENFPWVASFHSDDYVQVFDGATPREAIDKAITAATASADAHKLS